MQVHPQRPKTYSTRQGREGGRHQPANFMSRPRRPLDSSPVSHLEVDTDDNDITITEMSRRMIKRARQLSDTAEKNANCDPKKSKLSNDSERSLLSKTVLSRPLTDSSFRTPRLSTQSSTSSESVSTSDAESLSPIPLSRGALSRTSSRNLKENATSRRLASPFSSRPGSRAGSPLEARRRRLQDALKARTLSSDLSKRASASDLSHVSRGSSEGLANYPVESQSTASECYASARIQTTHTRTSSIPTLPSVTSESFSGTSWLVPPNIQSRSPERLGHQVRTLDTRRGSFYLDVPVQTSTPANKGKLVSPSRATREQIYSDDSDAYMSDASDNFALKAATAARALIPPPSPRQPRRRRRTLMHVSSDSIFSSPLDFSTYITDEDSPGHIRKSSHITDVMAPKNMPSVSQSVRKSDTTQLAPAFSLSMAVSESRHPVFSTCAPDAASHSLIHDDLGTLFADLDLNGPESRFDNDDLGVHIKSSPDDHPRGDVDLQNRPRRKRGDTIRASDFVRPAGEASSTFFMKESQYAKNSRSSTRRTRSGTVTLANSSSISVLNMNDKGKMNGIGVGIPKPANKGRHRKALPTIKMKIDSEPLPPQGSDEEDDELLLTGEEWNED